MKVFCLGLVLLVCGCVSTHWDIGDDSQYHPLVGQTLRTTRELRLYHAKEHQYTLVRYVLSPALLSGVTPETSPLGEIVATVPAGHDVRVLSFKRERGGDGHIWDHMLGEISISGRDEPITFEYLIGLTDEKKPLPFAK